MKRVSAQINEKEVADEADPIYQDSDFIKICVLPGALFCLDPLNRMSFFWYGPSKRYHFSLPLSFIGSGFKNLAAHAYQKFSRVPPREYGS